MRLTTLISKRLLVQIVVVGLFGVLALLQTTPASAASASKSCTLTGSNQYTCSFVITPAIATGAGSWLVQMVSPGSGTFASQPTVVSATGCGPVSITAGTFISSPSGNADYDVTVGGSGCLATATVTVTETVTVSATGQVCQNVWITAASPPVQGCASVTYTPPTAPPPPSATKTCTLTSTPNRYTCVFTVVPAFPAVAGDIIHVNEAPIPVVPNPGYNLVGTPTVGVVRGRAQTPTPVVVTSSYGFHATIGSSGCPGYTWSVQFLETIDVTASGQLCQSFYMVAAVPPTTACASVTYTPPAPGPAATKVCLPTSTKNVFTCIFTITPMVATAPGPWLVQMVTPGPDTFTAPSVVSNATAGCSTLPVVAAGTLISIPQGTADYNINIGAGGCTAAASIVITETVTVTATGQICQTVWITVGSPGVTVCGDVFYTKSLTSFSGTVAELDAAGAANVPVLVTASATANGKLITFVIGAPAFVNAEFNATFPNGLNATLMIVKAR